MERKKHLRFWLLIVGMVILASLAVLVNFTRADSGAPWATVITTNSSNVTIRVRVNDPSYIRLEYGLSTTYDMFMPAGSTATSASTDMRINPTYVNGVFNNFGDITLIGLCANTTYRFRVGSCSYYKGDECLTNLSLYAFSGQYDFKTAAGSSSCTVTPPADATPPNAPSNMTVNDVTSTHVALSWSVPYDDIAVTRWELKYKIGSTFLESYWDSALSLPVGQPLYLLSLGDTVTFGYNELTPSTTYILGLKAYDAVGNASPLAVSPSFTTLAPPPVTIPAAPTGLTAVYSTIPNGPEIQLRVTDNANNETEYRLYWRLLGTAWPSTFQPTGISTWSFPVNTGGMQIAAPATSGAYEYQLQACNSAGCSNSNIVLVNVPATTTPAPLTSSNECTSLVFAFTDNKTSYNVGDMVNYSYSCLPTGTSATNVTIQLVKPDNTSITYVTGNNVGAVLQQMGFSTSNLAVSSYILKACLNDTLCGAGSVYSLPFTVVGETLTSTPTPAPTSAPTSPSATPAPNPNPSSASSTSPAPITPAPSPSSGPNPNPTFIITPPTPPQFQPALSSLLGSKCMRYLNATKSALNSNERTIKNIKQKMRSAPENYVNLNAVTVLLSNADVALADARNLIKKKECSEQTLESINDKQDGISNAFEDITGYYNDELQYFRAYAQCKSTLANRTKKINALIKKEKNKQTKLSLQDAVSEIAQKSQKFAKDASSAQFPEVINQCKDYVAETRF